MPTQSPSATRRSTALIVSLGLLGGALPLTAQALPLTAQAFPPLPALDIDVSQTSVSGISSGGFMTVQFQVAHSSIVKGVGVVAGGPFNCSQADVMRAVASCSCTGEPTVPCAVTATSADVPSLVADTKKMADTGLVDPAEHLARQRILTVSGAKDTLVPPAIAEQLSAFYGAMGVPPANLSPPGQPVTGQPAQCGAHHADQELRDKLQQGNRAVHRQMRV